MIKRVLVPAVVGWLVGLMPYGPALADHLTGRYTMISRDQRTAQMAGSVMQLRQSGRSLVGEISGSNFRAQLQGETDGGNNARGYMTVQGGQRQYFEASFDQNGARLALIATDNQGRPDYNTSLTLLFAREGAGPGMSGQGAPGQPGAGFGQPGPSGGYPPPQGQTGSPYPYPPQQGPGGYPPQQGGPGSPYPYPPQQGTPGSPYPYPPQQGPPPGQWPR